jgi:hypothetical protein
MPFNIFGQQPRVAAQMELSRRLQVPWSSSRLVP